MSSFLLSQLHQLLEPWDELGVDDFYSAASSAPSSFGGGGGAAVKRKGAPSVDGVGGGGSLREGEGGPSSRFTDTPGMHAKLPPPAIPHLWDVGAALLLQKGNGIGMEPGGGGRTNGGLGGSLLGDEKGAPQPPTSFTNALFQPQPPSSIPSSSALAQSIKSNGGLPPKPCSSRFSASGNDSTSGYPSSRSSSTVRGRRGGGGGEGTVVGPRRRLGGRGEAMGSRSGAKTERTRLSSPGEEGWSSSARTSRTGDISSLVDPSQERDGGPTPPWLSTEDDGRVDRGLRDPRHGRGRGRGAATTPFLGSVEAGMAGSTSSSLSLGATTMATTSGAGGDASSSSTTTTTTTTTHRYGSAFDSTSRTTSVETALPRSIPPGTTSPSTSRPPHEESGGEAIHTEMERALKNGSRRDPPLHRHPLLGAAHRRVRMGGMAGASDTTPAPLSLSLSSPEGQRGKEAESSTSRIITDVVSPTLSPDARKGPHVHGRKTKTIRGNGKERLTGNPTEGRKKLAEGSLTSLRPSLSPRESPRTMDPPHARGPPSRSRSDPRSSSPTRPLSPVAHGEGKGSTNPMHSGRQPSTTSRVGGIERADSPVGSSPRHFFPAGATAVIGGGGAGEATRSLSSLFLSMPAMSKGEGSGSALPSPIMTAMSKGEGSGSALPSPIMTAIMAAENGKSVVGLSSRSQSEKYVSPPQSTPSKLPTTSEGALAGRTRGVSSAVRFSGGPLGRAGGGGEGGEKPLLSLSSSVSLLASATHPSMAGGRGRATAAGGMPLPPSVSSFVPGAGGISASRWEGGKRENPAANLFTELGPSLSKLELSRACVAVFLSNSGAFRPIFQKVFSFLFDYIDFLLSERHQLLHQLELERRKEGGGKKGSAKQRSSSGNGANSHGYSPGRMPPMPGEYGDGDLQETAAQAFQKVRMMEVQMAELVEQASVQRDRFKGQLASQETEIDRLKRLLAHQVQLTHLMYDEGLNELAFEGRMPASGATLNHLFPDASEFRGVQTFRSVGTDRAYVEQLIQKAQREYILDQLEKELETFKKEIQVLQERNKKLLALNGKYARQAAELAARLSVLAQYNIQLGADVQLYQRDLVREHQVAEKLMKDLVTARGLLMTFLEVNATQALFSTGSASLRRRLAEVTGPNALKDTTTITNGTGSSRSSSGPYSTTSAAALGSHAEWGKGGRGPLVPSDRTPASASFSTPLARTPSPLTNRSTSVTSLAWAKGSDWGSRAASPGVPALNSKTFRPSGAELLTTGSLAPERGSTALSRSCSSPSTARGATDGAGLTGRSGEGPLSAVSASMSGGGGVGEGGTSGSPSTTTLTPPPPPSSTMEGAVVVSSHGLTLPPVPVLTGYDMSVTSTSMPLERDAIAVVGGGTTTTTAADAVPAVTHTATTTPLRWTSAPAAGVVPLASESSGNSGWNDEDRILRSLGGQDLPLIQEHQLRTQIRDLFAVHDPISGGAIKATLLNILNVKHTYTQRGGRGGFSGGEGVLLPTSSAEMGNGGIGGPSASTWPTAGGTASSMLSTRPLESPVGSMTSAPPTGYPSLGRPAAGGGGWGGGTEGGGGVLGSFPMGTTPPRGVGREPLEWSSTTTTTGGGGGGGGRSPSAAVFGGSGSRLRIENLPTEECRMRSAGGSGGEGDGPAGALAAPSAFTERLWATPYGIGHQVSRHLCTSQSVPILPLHPMVAECMVHELLSQREEWTRLAMLEEQMALHEAREEEARKESERLAQEEKERQEKLKGRGRLWQRGQSMTGSRMSMGNDRLRRESWMQQRPSRGSIASRNGSFSMTNGGKGGGGRRASGGWGRAGSRRSSGGGNNSPRSEEARKGKREASHSNPNERRSSLAPPGAHSLSRDGAEEKIRREERKGWDGNDSARRRSREDGLPREKRRSSSRLRAPHGRRGSKRERKEGEAAEEGNSSRTRRASYRRGSESRGASPNPHASRRGSRRGSTATLEIGSRRASEARERAPLPLPTWLVSGSLLPFDDFIRVFIQVVWLNRSEKGFFRFLPKRFREDLEAMFRRVNPKYGREKDAALSDLVIARERKRKKREKRARQGRRRSSTSSSARKGSSESSYTRSNSEETISKDPRDETSASHRRRRKVSGVSQGGKGGRRTTRSTSLSRQGRAPSGRLSRTGSISLKKRDAATRGKGKRGKGKKGMESSKKDAEEKEDEDPITTTTLHPLPHKRPPRGRLPFLSEEAMKELLPAMRSHLYVSLYQLHPSEHPLLKLREEGLKLAYSLDVASRRPDSGVLTMAYGLISRQEVSEVLLEVWRAERELLLAMCKAVDEHREHHRAMVFEEARQAILRERQAKEEQEADERERWWRARRRSSLGRRSLERGQATPIRRRTLQGTPLPEEEDAGWDTKEGDLTKTTSKRRRGRGGGPARRARTQKQRTQKPTERLPTPRRAATKPVVAERQVGGDAMPGEPGETSPPPPTLEDTEDGVHVADPFPSSRRASTSHPFLLSHPFGSTQREEPSHRASFSHGVGEDAEEDNGVASSASSSRRRSSTTGGGGAGRHQRPSHHRRGSSHAWYTSSPLPPAYEWKLRGSIPLVSFTQILLLMFPNYPLRRIEQLVLAAAEEGTDQAENPCMVYYEVLLPERLLPTCHTSRDVPLSFWRPGAFHSLFYSFICDDAMQSMQHVEDGLYAVVEWIHSNTTSRFSVFHGGGVGGGIRRAGGGGTFSPFFGISVPASPLPTGTSESAFSKETTTTTAAGGGGLRRKGPGGVPLAGEAKDSPIGSPHHSSGGSGGSPADGGGTPMSTGTEKSRPHGPTTTAAPHASPSPAAAVGTGGGVPPLLPLPLPLPLPPPPLGSAFPLPASLREQLPITIPELITWGVRGISFKQQRKWRRGMVSMILNWPHLRRLQDVGSTNDGESSRWMRMTTTTSAPGSHVFGSNTLPTGSSGGGGGSVEEDGVGERPLGSSLGPAGPITTTMSGKHDPSRPPLHTESGDQRMAITTTTPQGGGGENGVLGARDTTASPSPLLRFMGAGGFSKRRRKKTFQDGADEEEEAGEEEEVSTEGRLFQLLRRRRHRFRKAFQLGMESEGDHEGKNPYDDSEEEDDSDDEEGEEDEEEEEEEEEEEGVGVMDPAEERAYMEERLTSIHPQVRVSVKEVMRFFRRVAILREGPNQYRSTGPRRGREMDGGETGVGGTSREGEAGPPAESGIAKEVVEKKPDGKRGGGGGARWKLKKQTAEVLKESQFLDVSLSTSQEVETFRQLLLDAGIAEVNGEEGGLISSIPTISPDAAPIASFATWKATVVGEKENELEEEETNAVAHPGGRGRGGKTGPYPTVTTITTTTRTQGSEATGRGEVPLTTPSCTAGDSTGRLSPGLSSPAEDPAASVWSWFSGEQVLYLHLLLKRWAKYGTDDIPLMPFHSLVHALHRFDPDREKIWVCPEVGWKNPFVRWTDPTRTWPTSVHRVEEVASTAEAARSLPPLRLPLAGRVRGDESGRETQWQTPFSLPTSFLSAGPGQSRAAKPLKTVNTEPEQAEEKR